MKTATCCECKIVARTLSTIEKTFGTRPGPTKADPKRRIPQSRCRRCRTAHRARRHARYKKLFGSPAPRESVKKPVKPVKKAVKKPAPQKAATQKEAPALQRLRRTYARKVDDPKWQTRSKEYMQRKLASL